MIVFSFPHDFVSSVEFFAHRDLLFSFVHPIYSAAGIILL